MKSLNTLFTVSELRNFRYHVYTIKVLINKRVCDHVTYTVLVLAIHFNHAAHMYTITCGQPESFCLYEKYLRSLGAPLVQYLPWRGKSNVWPMYYDSLCCSSYWHKYIVSGAYESIHLLKKLETHSSPASCVGIIFASFETRVFHFQATISTLKLN